MTNRYRFITRWRVEATAEEVWEIVSDPLAYPRWWPSVYLAVDLVAPGGEGGVGKRVRLHTQGRLPYTLAWEARTTVSRRPNLLEIEATGDFNGRGVWNIVEDGPCCDIGFDWKLTADKPLLRRLSFLLKPAFEANHRWAMDQGARALELELARRRACTVEELNAIPDPEGPADWREQVAIGGAIAAAGLVNHFFHRKPSAQ